MDLDAPDLGNDLITLAPLDETYREALRASDAVEYMWLSLPAIQRGAGFDVYYDHALKSAKRGEYLPFALLDPKQDNRFVGVTAYIEPNRTHRRVQIGYTWLEPYLRGRGVYAAIQRLMIERALDWGAKRMSWPIEAHNERAINAVQALGAVHEGVLRSYERFADGQWVDVAILSMLRDEAREALKRLDMVIAAATEA